MIEIIGPDPVAAVSGAEQVALVEAAGAAQLGAVNAAGTTQVGNVNTAGSTQVGNVNTAGAAQVAAIEDKGEETLESIPSDYTNLSNTVANLSSAIDDKIDEPSADGSAGQVLATDGEGGRYWKTVSGGSSGTSDYTDLTNKPQIGGVTLAGNKSLNDLGIASSSALGTLTVEEKLLRSELPGTTVTVTFDSNDNPSTITHSVNSTEIRTDVFTWTENSVTEVRTLSSGESITIETNLETLAQTISEVEVA